MTFKTISLCAGAAAAALIAATAVSADAEARERRVRGSVDTARGTSTFERVSRAEPGFRERRTDWVGPEGGEGYRDFGREFGRTETGGYDHVDVERGFNDGTTRTRATDRVWSGEEGTYSSGTDWTFRDGSTAAGTTDVERLDEGVFGFNRTFTNREGEVFERSGEVTVERTDWTPVD